jgi:cytochrome c oxidase cbb3-type subunit I/II
MLYWLFPRLYKTKLWSTKLANYHFWIALLGMMFYVVPMYVSGVTQGLMWKQFSPDGFLQYPNFLEIVQSILPMHQLRAVGGTLYITGVVLMAVNLYKTARSGKFVPDEEVQAPRLRGAASSSEAPHPWGHRWLEAKPMTFTALAIVAVVIGGLIEIVPMWLVKENVPTIAAVKPYSPLELLGRDIYIREGCVGCHSQMIRPFRSETERYGEYSKAGEFVYDHPFLWGSKRTGPDLHREGGKYPEAWHYRHMENPRDTSPGSIMPSYPWLLTQDLETNSLPARIKALRKVGVPYPAGYENGPAEKELVTQASQVTLSLKVGQVDSPANKEIIAVIAYLQRLGKDIKAAAPQPAQSPVATTANN